MKTVSATLRGSRPRHLTGATPVARALGEQRAGRFGADREAPDSTKVGVTLVLRGPAVAEDHPARRKAKRNATALPHLREELADHELEHLHAAPVNELELVRKFAEGHGLHVQSTSRLLRHIVVEGTVEKLEAAFGVSLGHYHAGHVRYRAHEEEIQVPAEIADIVVSVLGLDDIPRLRSRRRVPASANTLTPAQLAAYYQFPADLSGRGQKIAILVFGGGYHQDDLDQFFARCGGTVPKITNLCLRGATNTPLARPRLQEFLRLSDLPRTNGESFTQALGEADVDSALSTAEATMDVQIIGALAPGAEIEVIFAPPDLNGLHAAFAAVLSPEREPPAIVSVSFGVSERSLDEGSLKAIAHLLELAHDRGIVVCAASGDNGSLGAGDDDPNLAAVCFPASSPHVLACGGSSFTRKEDRITGEVVWNVAEHGMRLASAGGISGYFPRPHYQASAKVPTHASLDGPAWIAASRDPLSFVGRGVPDVAAVADQRGGLELVLGGRKAASEGTSAAAPIWAALLARLGEAQGGRLGALHHHMYSKEGRAALAVVRKGTNNLGLGKAAAFSAVRGWSACTGLGTPRGDRLRAALAAPAPRARKS